jgi:hypothetical protein
MKLKARLLPGAFTRDPFIQAIRNFIKIPNSVDGERILARQVNGGRPIDEIAALCKRGSRKPRPH